jgi:hypothetical protein
MDAKRRELSQRVPADLHYVVDDGWSSGSLAKGALAFAFIRVHSRFNPSYPWFRTTAFPFRAVAAAG